MRNGNLYLEQIDDGRVVWLGSRKVSSVPSDPAFRQAARSFARLFDMASEPEWQDTLTFQRQAGGPRLLRPYQIATEPAHLQAKRQAHKLWAESSYGFLGRSFDYMASGLAGFAARPDFFRGGDYDGSAVVQALHQRAASDSLFLAFTITNPKVDKNRSLAQQGEENDIGVRATRETDAGIYVSGAKSIGTAAVFADEIIVGTIEPLPTEDLEYALSFSLRPNSPGVSLISRASYEQAAGHGHDRPLSSRFDENDALLVLDNVFIPWENVISYRDVGRTFGMWWETPAYTNMAHQASIRFWTKLEFLAGLAKLVCDSNGSAGHPQVRAELGRLLGYTQLARATVLGAEAGYERRAEDGGAIRLSQEICYAQRIQAGELYPKFLHELKLLCGGALIQLPESVADIAHPDIGPMLKRFLRGHDSDAEARARLMQLVWDATGSEFASRHAHYEQFYQGAPHVYLAQMTYTGLAERYARHAASALEISP